MKKRLPHLSIAALCLILCLTMSAAVSETKVMIISDPHYLSDTLYRKDDPAFLAMLRNSDGKVTQYSEELSDALIAEVLHQQPAALIITGDLTYNGEEQSHRRFAGKLSVIRNEGIPVYVIPGNHDINTLQPVGFSEAGRYAANNIDEQGFLDIYRDFLCPPEGAADANMSYHVKVGDRLWIALADVACYRGMAYTNGIFTKDHETWLEDVLKNAIASEAVVITASHHNLFAHSGFEQEYYVMSGNEKLIELKNQYGSRLHLSGHLHIQHIVTDGLLADAATGAFSIYPHYYAVITLHDDGTLEYRVRSLCASHLPEHFF